jgi:predicted nucleic acid-binding protein
LVLDASVALAWFIDTPIPPYAALVRRELLRGATALVPWLWHLEIANGFAVAERRGIVTRSDVDAGVTHIEQLLPKPIETDTAFIGIRQALRTATASRLSAYDAVYLRMAREHSLPLATLDKRLREAAVRAGLELFE